MRALCLLFVACIMVLPAHAQAAPSLPHMPLDGGPGEPKPALQLPPDAAQARDGAVAVTDAVAEGVMESVRETDPDPAVESLINAPQILFDSLSRMRLLAPFQGLDLAIFNQDESRPIPPELPGSPPGEPAGDDAFRHRSNEKTDDASADRERVDRTAAAAAETSELPSPRAMKDVPVTPEKQAHSAVRARPEGEPAATWHVPADASSYSIGAFVMVACVVVAWRLALKLLTRSPFLVASYRKEGLLEQRRRQQIHHLVRAHPGIHYREIVRRLRMGHGQAEWHLQRLVAAGKVTAVRRRGYTGYFVDREAAARIGDAAPMVRSTGAKSIMNRLLAEPDRSASQLARATGLTRQAVSYHLRRLASVGLVAGSEGGASGRYHVTHRGRAALGAEPPGRGP